MIEPPTTAVPAAGGVREAVAAHPVSMVWLGTVLFSTGPVMVAGATISGPVFSFWRLWFGAAAMGLAHAASRARTSAPSARGWQVAAACGVAFSAHQLTGMTALRTTSVVDVTLMNTLAPIVVGLLAVRAFGERPGVRFRAWSAVAMAGGAVVALAGSTGPEGEPLGMVLAATSIAFYAVFFVGSKLARPDIEPIAFMVAMLTSAAVTTSLFLVAMGEAPTPISTHDLLLCAAVAVVPGSLGHLAITWSLRWVPANVPPVIGLAMPVLAGALAWWLLGQEIRTAQVLGGAVVLIGVAGAVRSPSAHRLGADEALVLAEET